MREKYMAVFLVVAGLLAAIIFLGFLKTHNPQVTGESPVLQATVSDAEPEGFPERALNDKSINVPTPKNTPESSLMGRKISPENRELIADSFFFDIGFENAVTHRGIEGFLPVLVNNESSLEDYGFLAGDIITEIDSKSVPKTLDEFLRTLENLYSNPKTFFDEVIVFTINRNNEILELEVAID